MFFTISFLVVPVLILHYYELLHLHHVTEQTEKCLCFTKRYVKHSTETLCPHFLSAFMVCTHKHTYFFMSFQNYKPKSIPLKENLHFLCSKQKYICYPVLSFGKKK